MNAIRTKKCLRCGLEFIPNRPCRWKRAKYCSKKCFTTPFAERFWKLVHKTEGCWFWTGSAMPFPNNYGSIRNDRYKKIRVHRASWELHFGKIPKGKLVCHTCDNPSCVRPDHLFLGTRKSNAADMVEKGRHGCGDIKGERHPLHKLKETNVKYIRKAYESGERVLDLAAKFQLHWRSVYDILYRKTWKHI